MVSVSRMTVATMQDLLQLDETARMNIPSTLGWELGMENDQRAVNGISRRVLTWNY